ncbi:phosphate/phosphite/phosphonate ABC transporter substrate-binding protein [Synechococcus sp. KORDI-52]|uniref:phosphate/phosphite/phosphonate ABC transporter substrate-binding protein n=1 Tax=Synechococcus sp. KORDI-52 TaxID=585425 RepID=UPI001C1E3DC4|nr:PhnD/SsuA/transferrin family substrate-binding protein [Synechococcus sp. KORDI-52]
MKIVLSLIVLLALLSCKSNNSQPTHEQLSSKTKKDTFIKQQDCAGSSSTQAQRRIFAAIPRLTASDIHSIYWPLLTKIGQQTNVCFEIKHHKSNVDYLAAIEAEEIDYTFMCPFQQSKHNDKYEPIIRDEKSHIKGIIVANKSSGIKQLSDIENETFVAPFGTAFGASLLNKSYLDINGIDLPVRYVKTHQNVYRIVATDPSIIGGGVFLTYQREDENLRSQLTIIAETLEFPAHPFSASTKLPNSEVQDIQQAWLNLRQDDRHASMLRSAQLTHPIPANYTRDYASIKELNLQQYLQ